MRTREEQIDSLYHGHNRYSTITQDAFRDHLIEAERRAEQRVRTVIARDSERLDWLENLPFADIGRLSDGWEICINNVRHWDMQATLRSAIDAAREVKE